LRLPGSPAAQCPASSPRTAPWRLFRLRLERDSGLDRLQPMGPREALAQVARWPPALREQGPPLPAAARAGVRGRVAVLPLVESTRGPALERRAGAWLQSVTARWAAARRREIAPVRPPEPRFLRAKGQSPVRRLPTTV
jgi:hypothetical protein